MEGNQSVFELEVDQVASKNLIDAARWARFIAIFVFIAMGCFLLLMIIGQSQISSAFSDFMPGESSINGFGVLLGVFIFIAIIVCVVFYFLIRGANLIRKGIEAKNILMLNDGLRSLKTYFIIYGVLAILGLLVNLIALI